MIQYVRAAFRLVFEMREAGQPSTSAVLYFEACLAEDPGDGSLIRAALGDIARARGMSQLARETGLSREGLYQALSAKGNPEFSTIMKVIRALGLKLHAEIEHV